MIISKAKLEKLIEGEVGKRLQEEASTRFMNDRISELERTCDRLSARLEKIESIRDKDASEYGSRKDLPFNRRRDGYWGIENEDWTLHF